MCAPSNDIFPPHERHLYRYRNFARSEAPPTDSICKSAVVAFLFLARDILRVSAPDMYHLMAAGLGHPESEYIQLLPDLHEGECLHTVKSILRLSHPKAELCPDTTQPGSQPGETITWYSVEPTSVLPTSIARASTKVLSFPSTLPPYQVNWRYMEVCEPHGSHPTSKSKCAIWGSWDDEKTAWRSVATFSNRQMASVYDKNLRGIIKNVPNLSLQLSSHWIHLVRYIYMLGINDGRLIIRDAMKNIDTIVRDLGSPESCIQVD